MPEIPLTAQVRDLRTSVILGLCCLLVYNANGRAISAGDAFPARYLPFAIWAHGTLTLDPIESLTTQGRAPLDPQRARPEAAFWVVTAPTGHRVSLYPVVLPVLIAPLYLPAVGYVHLRGWTEERIDRVARIMEKLTASGLAALSVSGLYLLLRRRAAPSIAVLLAVAYAFGTTTWVISSQALWQHGLAQLLVVGAMLILTGSCTAPRALAAGLLCGLLAGNRPPDAILAAALGAYGLYWAGRRSVLLVAAAAAPAVLVLVYNVTVVGAIGGGYELIARRAFVVGDVASGLAGLLFSPTRGLFVFSPFLLFLVLAWRHAPRDAAGRGLTLAVAAAAAVQILLYALVEWRGGLSWGPRFMTDLLPLLVWLLAPVVAALERPGRVCFVTAVAVAIAIETVGAFTYTGVTDHAIFAVDGPDRLRAAWNWHNAPFIASRRAGLAPPDLALEPRGAIDAILVSGRRTDTVVAGEEMVVDGWALAGRRSPLQVAVAVDLAPPVLTRTFVDRPDVRAAVPGAGPAGWRVRVDTAGLAPGEHQVSVRMWTSDIGDTRLLARRTLVVEPRSADGDLAASFRTAAARVGAHQQEPGYWLTAFTHSTRFEHPDAEMNVYLTALMVDLLDPVAAAAGLGGNVQRARRHLTAQIEAGGLVRYHGRPDGPGIGTLGCAITPDTDDTALVWRIAPGPDRTQLAAALRTVDGYRREDGLYRTWLSPRERYQCLDPGRDPNPADVAIQIHLLQLLATERPAAGRALCDALRRRLDDDRIWVYYGRSPLVPILRQTALERAGCKMPLSESRMRTTVPGQEAWVAVARQLAGRPGPAQAGTPEVEALLSDLARDDFARLRRDPPLLYHNDLTATVPRYYWSEDVGYALWLRLAHEHATIGYAKPGA